MWIIKSLLAADALPQSVVADANVTTAFARLLDSFVAASTGTSNRVPRMILLADPPSLDIGEMTDKGSINQRAVLKNRAALVDELYAETPSPRVIAAKTVRAQ